MAKEMKAAEIVAMDVEGFSNQIRDFTEKGVEQSKDLYEAIKTGTEDTQKAVEQTFEAAREAGSTLSLKALGAVRSHADASFEHIEALFGATTLAKMIELQSAFVRKQFDIAAKQAKELQSASTKALEKIVEPTRTVFEKSAKSKAAA